MSKTIKKIIIILVILALVGVGASLFLGNGEQATSQLQSLTTGSTAAPLTESANTSSTVTDTEEINREFISMLLNLQSIELSDDIFSEAAFQALVDNTVRLNQPGNEGRPNPFAPIGSDSLFSAGAVNNQASALNALDSATDSQIQTTSQTEGVESTSANPADPMSQLTGEELEQALSSLGSS